MSFSCITQKLMDERRYKFIKESLQKLIYYYFSVREGRSDFYLAASKDLNAVIESADVPVSKLQCLLDRIRMNVLSAKAHYRHRMCFLNPSIKNLLLTPCRRKALFKPCFQRYKLSFSIAHGSQSSIAGGRSV